MTTMLFIALATTWIALAVLTSYNHVTGLGKYITIPMLRVYYSWRLRNKVGTSIYLIPSQVRLVQMLVLWVINLALVAMSQTVPELPLVTVSVLVYWIPGIALYADDLLTLFDKDKWKKRWQSVKNKLKWKMTLPIPVPTR